MWRNTVSFILALGILATPVAAEVSPKGKAARIGMLLGVSPDFAAPYIATFQRGLHALGYTEGQNMAIEYRFAVENGEPLSALVAALVRLQVDVIVTWGTPAAQAAKHATSTIPIVMAAVFDPVGTGLVAGLARPGGNVTGVTSGFAELSGKNLELLTQLVPGVTRVAVLWVSANPANALELKETKAAAQALGLQLHIVDIHEPTEFDSAFVAMTRERAEALLVLNDPLFLVHRTRIVDLTAKSRLPAMYERRAYAEAGGLMAYGVNFHSNFWRAAVYVDKILKGAKPGDIPVEHPMKFELVINLKTAKALGLTIPPMLLFQADEVIQ